MPKKWNRDDTAAVKYWGKTIGAGILFGDENCIGIVLKAAEPLRAISKKYIREKWIIFAIAGIVALLTQVTHSLALSILICAVIAGILFTQPKPRRFILGLLAMSKSSLREYKALLNSIFDPNPAPQVLELQDDGTAVKVQVRLSPGQSYADLEKALETFLIAGEFGSGHLSRSPKNASLCEFSFVRGAPLTEAFATWPSDNAARSVWDGIALGPTEDGPNLNLDLYGRNVFIAGEPNSGKTVAGRNIVCNFALDPKSEILIGDAKGLDFTLWESFCTAYAGTSLADWEEMLTKGIAILNWRLEYLRSHKLKKWTPDCGGLVLILLEEFGSIVSQGKEAKACVDMTRDLLQRGRAAGIICVLSTQRPGSDTFPTALRDLVGVRMSFRCSTRDASDIALGAGWAAQGFNASTIPSSSVGIGYCLAESGIPILFRGVYVSDEQEQEIIDAACRMRGIDPGADQLDDEIESGDFDD